MMIIAQFVRYASGSRLLAAGNHSGLVYSRYLALGTFTS